MSRRKATTEDKYKVGLTDIALDTICYQCEYIICDEEMYFFKDRAYSITKERHLCLECAPNIESALKLANAINKRWW